MPAEEVRHISSTYNLVYNLQISEQTVLAALNTATDENYGEVNLEYFIAALQELHFRESGAYWTESTHHYLISSHCVALLIDLL